MQDSVQFTPHIIKETGPPEGIGTYSNESVDSPIVVKSPSRSTSPIVVKSPSRSASYGSHTRTINPTTPVATAESWFPNIFSSFTLNADPAWKKIDNIMKDTVLRSIDDSPSEDSDCSTDLKESEPNKKFNDRMMSTLNKALKEESSDPTSKKIKDTILHSIADAIANKDISCIPTKISSKEKGERKNNQVYSLIPDCLSDKGMYNVVIDGISRGCIQSKFKAFNYIVDLHREYMISNLSPHTRLYPSYNSHKGYISITITSVGNVMYPAYERLVKSYELYLML
jgi:hypothetical protein